MKRNRIFSLLLIALLPLMSFQSKPADDGYYAILIVNGVFQNENGFASRIIYFPGYTDCNKHTDIDFFREAERAFGNHLKAYYTETFPYGSSHIQRIDTKKYSTTERMRTKAQAEQALTEWVAEQKEKGYKVSFTNFSFSCEDL